MKVYFLTLFPNELTTYFMKGIFKKACDKGILEVTFLSIRDFSDDKHHKVDDYPFSKKQGMLLKADVLYRAITSIADYDKYRIIYACPKGNQFTQDAANRLCKEKGIILISGYYEGIDERLFDLLPIEKVSIGPYVLSSGDSAALVIAESIVRLCEGVVGKKISVEDDSIVSGLLEGPQYTQPRDYKGKKVPECLLSGNHDKIRLWKKKQAFEQTYRFKPSLLCSYQPSKEDVTLITSMLQEE